jgi:hypothetical protein
MKNPFKRRRPVRNPDTDPIVITHKQDPSLAEDEMIIHTTIDPDSVGKVKNSEKTHWPHKPTKEIK